MSLKKIEKLQNALFIRFYPINANSQKIPAECRLQKALETIEVLQGAIDKQSIFAHRHYVEPLLDYILEDFEGSRSRFGDRSIGGMVICDSSEQAKMLYELFQSM